MSERNLDVKHLRVGGLAVQQLSPKSKSESNRYRDFKFEQNRFVGLRERLENQRSHIASLELQRSRRDRCIPEGDAFQLFVHYALLATCAVSGIGLLTLGSWAVANREGKDGVAGLFLSIGTTMTAASFASLGLDAYYRCRAPSVGMLDQTRSEIRDLVGKLDRVNRNLREMAKEILRTELTDKVKNIKDLRDIIEDYVGGDIELLGVRNKSSRFALQEEADHDARDVEVHVSTRNQDFKDAKSAEAGEIVGGESFEGVAVDANIRPIDFENVESASAKNDDDDQSEGRVLINLRVQEWRA